MKITINGTGYTPYFGLDFIENLDNSNIVQYNGSEITVGTTMVIGLLADTRNPKYLVPIIKAALCTEDTIPTDVDLKKWVEGQENIKNTVDAFLLNLQKVNLLQEMVNWKSVKIQNKEALKMYLS
ncbi:tail assembly chaperone [Enterococcus sp. 2201sp1_2201st1_B8_2201SCRN_220225]|uniref:tail assembly chaperone n=1 Tax=unclassified Enterococcus TaxID=2608891 RepID=UPI0034A55582